MEGGSAGGREGLATLGGERQNCWNGHDVRMRTGCDRKSKYKISGNSSAAGRRRRGMSRLQNRYFRLFDASGATSDLGHLQNILCDNT